MGMQSTASGIILAGGISRRLGRDKAVEPFEGEPLIARVIGRLSNVASQTVVVVNDASRSTPLPLPNATTEVVKDLYPDGGSLGGIFTGLSAIDGDWGVVVACDMPFLNVGLLQFMLDSREGFDAVVPVLGGRPEPTHAVYNKNCLPYMERRLKSNDLKITDFFDEIRVRFLDEDEVGRFDPGYLSFFNINTPDDLGKALCLAKRANPNPARNK